MDAIPLSRPQFILTHTEETDFAREHLNEFTGALAADRRAFRHFTEECPGMPVGMTLNCPPLDPDREGPWTEEYFLSCKQAFLPFMDIDAAFWYIRGAVDFPALRTAVLALTDLSGRAIVTALPMAEGERLMDNTDCVAAVGVLQRIGVSTVIITGDDQEAIEDALERLAPYARLSIGVRCPMAWYKNGLTLTNTELLVPAHRENVEDLYKLADKPTYRVIERDDLEEYILAPDGRDAHFVEPTTDISDEIECGDPMLAERLIELEDEEAAAFKLVIEEESDLAALEEEMYMISRPICLCAEDPALLERALRIYCGLALYDGTWEQEEEVLHLFERKYGMIRL
ncbi:MAG: hypothetical protein IJ452_05590 [Butyricicoccus sp.]|nr:hypothetical protein [Butyricicoccus sp.]MBQ8585739.1 hypothetical protein [Butyricicoccus sp.]